MLLSFLLMTFSPLLAIRQKICLDFVPLDIRLLKCQREKLAARWHRGETKFRAWLPWPYSDGRRMLILNLKRRPLWGLQSWDTGSAGTIDDLISPRTLEPSGLETDGCLRTLGSARSPTCGTHSVLGYHQDLVQCQDNSNPEYVQWLNWFWNKVSFLGQPRNLVSRWTRLFFQSLEEVNDKLGIDLP